MLFGGEYVLVFYLANCLTFVSIWRLWCRQLSMSLKSQSECMKYVQHMSVKWKSMFYLLTF